MTPDEQQIAIARACGWTLQQAEDERTWWTVKPDGSRVYGDGPERYWPTHVLPDYLNDLNAMHEAEKHIKDWPKWVKMLAKVIAGVPEATRAGGTKVFVDNSIIARATASQRAEAFLRTLNLWKS